MKIIYPILIKKNHANEGTKSWPQGTWGLPMPNAGCPDLYDWQHGYRYQDTENSHNANQWSDVNHFPITGEDANNYYCMKTDTEGSHDWPAGGYRTLFL